MKSQIVVVVAHPCERLAEALELVPVALLLMSFLKSFIFLLRLSLLNCVNHASNLSFADWVDPSCWAAMRPASIPLMVRLSLFIRASNLFWNTIGDA